MTRRMLLASEGEVKGAIIGFQTSIEPNDFNKLQLAACENLVCAFMRAGVEFEYTAKVQKETATFNATRHDGQPRITVFYETGSALRCFWIMDGEEEEFTFSYEDIQNPSRAIQRIVNNWLAHIDFCDEKAVNH